MTTSSVTSRTQTQVKTRSTPVETRKPSTEPKKESKGATARQPKSNDHFEHKGASTSTRSESSKTPAKTSSKKSTSASSAKHAGTSSTKSKKSSGSSGSQGTLKTAYADNSKKAAEAKADPRYASELKSVAKLSPEKRKLIDDIARKADLPPALVAGIWNREGSMREDVYMHNGDPLGKPTQNVPTGKFFRKDQFSEAAVDAFKDKLKTQQALNLHYDSKDMGAMATYAEAYNGFGYRKNGHTNPYAFAGTDQYKGGLYVKDHKYSADAVDHRLGVLAYAQEYMKQQ